MEFRYDNKNETTKIRALQKPRSGGRYLNTLGRDGRPPPPSGPGFGLPALVTPSHIALIASDEKDRRRNAALAGLATSPLLTARCSRPVRFAAPDLAVSDEASCPTAPAAVVAAVGAAGFASRAPRLRRARGFAARASSTPPESVEPSRSSAPPPRRAHQRVRRCGGDPQSPSSRIDAKPPVGWAKVRGRRHRTPSNKTARAVPAPTGLLRRPWS